MLPTILLCLSMPLAVNSPGPLPGQTVDVVPFGEIDRWESDGKDHGVFWEDARDLFRAEVEFAEAAAVPSPDAVHLEYWQSSWPERRIPRDRPSGAGESGWLDIGDWFQGKWVRADAQAERRGAALSFTFNPVNAREFPKLKDFPAAYRSTLKLRLVGDAPLPAVKSLAAYTDSVWDEAEVLIEWGGRAEQEEIWDGRLEVFNGHVQSVAPLAGGTSIQVAGDFSWKSKARGRTEGIRARLLFARPRGTNSFDETVVTVRAAREVFSFSIADLDKSGPIFLPDLGALVCRADQSTTYAETARRWQEKKGQDLYARVVAEEEQTLPRAWKDMPEKGRHYIPLSFEGGRQHFLLDENGGATAIKNWISRLRGRDTERCRWPGQNIHYSFGLDGPLKDRRLVDGDLPMAVSEWEREGVRCRQTAFVIPLQGVPRPGERILAEDPLVLMVRFEMAKVQEAVDEARLELRVSHQGGKEKLRREGGGVFGGGGKDALRLWIASRDPQERWSISEGENGLLCKAALSAGAGKAVLELAIPYLTLSEEKEMAALRALDFDRAFEEVRQYWRGRLEAGAQIRTPEPMINEFYRAHASHLLINTEREVGGSDRYMAKVGTFHYGVFSNESCMMVSDLDRRGYHERAAQALETWLHYQGTVKLPGDFSSAEGQFYGAGGYEHGGYNQHHGWVLWCLGEHYFYTRDDTWLAHAAPSIIKGCEWIIRERRRNAEIASRSKLRALERGLLPPGRLEDIGDWRSWLSTNVYSCWGLRNAAAALAAGKHPEGERLLAEAGSYHQDLLAAFLEAMRRSPVVRLRDGSWIPHLPSEAHRRGRSFGWITETLEGAIHLVRCGVLEPWDRLSTWIVKDFEDNLYLSEQFGYNLRGADFDRWWFSRGGISMQANLLCNPIPYLLRDEPKHFLRAYFNAFAASYFPDTRMMTEHALPNIGDWRGDHYKSSDEANSTFWLRLAFIHERGEELWLGQAVPRYWLKDGQAIGVERAATYFGPMSVRIESRAARGEIEMIIDPPLRNPPKLIRARIRHPEGKRPARFEVNGTRVQSFDAEKEWVELKEWTRPARVVAFY
ncbi:MAG: hypothetical protein HY717_19820 [Planctomycetes bacterium]|nr:hypothetical protein [Planctomycetota bacterium]